MMNSRPVVLASDGGDRRSASSAFTPLYEIEVGILVIYTGGTIGMKKNEDGVWVPAKNFLHDFLKEQPLFHDKDYAEAKKRAFECHRSQEFLEPLYLPKHSSREPNRVAYTIYEYDPLIDSANADYALYERLALDIQKFYLDFDGFVVLHGTDTMAFTSSTLSFMLNNLGKPVVITGSQLPIIETLSDGRNNFLSALLIASHYPIAEVSIFFDSKLLRGNRSTKVHSEAFKAFDSPNFPPLATAGIAITVNWDLVLKPSNIEKFYVRTTLSPNVAVLRIFPNITAEAVKGFLQPPIEGVVLQCYGSGNFPESNLALLAELEEATKRGVIIVNTSQCQQGSVAASYAGSQALLKIGVVPGYDITSEAALGKLSLVLTKTEWSPEEKRKFMQTDVAGELTNTEIGSESMNFALLKKFSALGNAVLSQDTAQARELMVPAILYKAIRQNDTDAVKKIVEAFPGNVLTPDYEGRTCLHLAVREASIDLVRYLLTKGSSVHVRDRNDKSALLEAVYARRFDVIKILLDTGAHLVMHPAKLATELSLAISCGDVPLVKAFIAAKAKMSVWDYNHRTPLHAAASLGRADIVQLLLDAGADSSIIDVRGSTALDDARRAGHDNVIAILDPK